MNTEEKTMESAEKTTAGAWNPSIARRWIKETAQEHEDDNGFDGEAAEMRERCFEIASSEESFRRGIARILNWDEEFLDKAVEEIKSAPDRETKAERRERIGREIGALVAEKDAAYGSSFRRAPEILAVLYPDGVRPDQYRDMLGITRVIDKLFRIANKKDAFGESAWRDLGGYGVVGVATDEEEAEERRDVELERAAQAEARAVEVLASERKLEAAHVNGAASNGGG